MGEQPCSLNLRRHVGQHMLHHLVMYNRTATLDADEGMLARQLKSATGEAHCDCCPLTAPIGTEVVDQASATALFGEQMLGGHIGIFQIKLHQRAGA